MYSCGSPRSMKQLFVEVAREQIGTKTFRGMWGQIMSHSSGIDSLQSIVKEEQTSSGKLAVHQ
jgi:hypothetical protein